MKAILNILTIRDCTVIMPEEQLRPLAGHGQTMAVRDVLP
jgi:hypothetical protein